MVKFIWDVTHWEKFTVNWEEKTKWTKVWALFYNGDRDSYSVNFLWQWLNVFPKKENNIPKQVTTTNEEISIEDIPFN